MRTASRYGRKASWLAACTGWSWAACSPASRCSRAAATDRRRLLAHLVDHLRQRGFTLFDVQYVNDHTASLGAIEIPRREYLARLKDALMRDVTFG